MFANEYTLMHVTCHFIFTTNILLNPALQDFYINLHYLQALTKGVYTGTA